MEDKGVRACGFIMGEFFSFQPQVSTNFIVLCGSTQITGANVAQELLLYRFWS